MDAFQSFPASNNTVPEKKIPYKPVTTDDMICLQGPGPIHIELPTTDFAL